MADSVRIPRWARAVWGLVLACLNVFEVVYLVGFSSMVFTFGTGSPSPSSRFFEGSAFMTTWLVTAASVLLSFAFIALSLVHVLAWSDLPTDRKVLWAIAVFMGAQPAMLVYWYLHVWRSGRLHPARQRTAAKDTVGRRIALVFLGVLTITPILYFAFFFLTIGGSIMMAPSGSAAGGIFGWIIYAHMGVILLWFVLTAVYLVDVFRNPRLVGNARILWAVVIAFGGPVGWPVYWYMNMWRRTASHALNLPGDQDAGPANEARTEVSPEH